MDSQFRCGKCGKPIGSKFTKCLDCGYLGPHDYNAPPVGAPELTAGPQASHRREPPPFDRGEPAPPMRQERYSPPPDIPPDLPSPGRHDDGDNKFPAGMRHRSPILDHIEGMTEQDGQRAQKEPRKKPKKEQPPEDGWEATERPASRKHFKDFLEEDEEEEKQQKPSGPGIRSIINIGISLVLIVALVLGAFYIYYNFDSLTRQLAVPTTPETPKPTGQAPTTNTTQPSNPLAWLSGIWPANTTTSKPAATDNPSPPAAQNPVPAVTQPTTPAAPPVSTPSPATSSDTTVPVIYEPVFKSINERGATITWKTSEPCISEIHYKTNLGDTKIQNVSTNPSLNHSVTFTDLDAGQTYYIKLQCEDNGGNIAKPLERSFQTLLISADTVAPKLAGQPAVSADSNSATVTWQTDEKAKSQVKYSLSDGAEFPSAFTDYFSTSHSVLLSGLSPATTYRYKLISRDAAGNVMTSSLYEFRTEPETGAAPYISSKAPNFTLRNLKGETVSLSQYRGKKVILNFWASWCTPCKIEIPHFQALWDKISANNDVMLLTVAGSQSEEDLVRSFVANGNYTFMVCLDPGEDAFNKYELTSIPKTYFIDKDGVIRRIQQGMFTSPGEIEFLLNSY